MLTNHVIHLLDILVLFYLFVLGIAFLEYSGVSHRDLKTDNILVDLAGKLFRCIISL